jgi:hypothetical protein
MAEMPIQALAPFGGITRIRFKGSAPKPFEALSAIAAPPQYCFSLRIGLARAKSTCAEIVGRQYQALGVSQRRPTNNWDLLARIYPGGDVCGGGATFVAVWKMPSH